MKRKIEAIESHYPESCDFLTSMIKGFNRRLKDVLGSNKLPDVNPRAIIVPDSEYVYSGYTANFAYKVAKKRKKELQRIIVIGAGEASFEGISGSFFKRYKTPCGKLKMDLLYLSMLKERCGVGFAQEAHQSISTEVQMPFIKHYFNKLPVIELLYGDVKEDVLQKLIEVCLADKGNLLVVCSDLGDMQLQKELGILDSTYINAISELDADALTKRANASGVLALKALLKSAKASQLKAQVLNYQTSSIQVESGVQVEGHLSVALH